MPVKISTFISFFLTFPINLLVKKRLFHGKKPTLNLIPGRKPQELCEFPVSELRPEFLPSAAETTPVYIHLEGALAQTGGDKWRFRKKKWHRTLSVPPPATHKSAQKERDGREKRAPVASCQLLFCGDGEIRLLQMRQTDAINDISRVSERGASLFECSQSSPGRNTPSSLPLHPTVGCHSSVCALKTQLTVACSPAGKSN